LLKWYNSEWNRVGEYREWDKEGKLKIKGTFSTKPDRFVETPFEEYYPSGKIAGLFYPSNSDILRFVGKFKRFWENGNVKVTGELDNYSHHIADVMSYDENGKLTDKMMFNGKGEYLGHEKY